MNRRLLALVAPALAIAPSSTVPPDNDSSIDSAAALAVVEEVITENPSSGYPAVVIDECPFGSVAEIGDAVNAVVPLNPLVLSDGETHAWVNPDNDQPGFGCWVAYDSLDEPGIFWVEVYAKSWRGGKFEGITWGDRWIRVDQSSEPYLNGELHVGCLVEEDPADTDRVCMAQWFDPTVGLQFDLDLETNDGSVTADDARTAILTILPALAEALATSG